MPRFSLRAKARPDEVSVAIGSCGTLATVFPPQHWRKGFPLRSMTLSTSLHYAGSLAEQLGTDVGILNGTDAVFLIEDLEEQLIVPAA